MTLAEANLYISNIPLYIEYFGEEIFKVAIKKYDEADFSTTRYIEINNHLNNYYRQKGYKLVRENILWKFTERQGEWERQYEAHANEWQIPSDYHVNDGKLIKDCILLFNPALTHFDMKCYYWYNSIHEVYITCDNNHSLYVPIEAIITKDYSLVEKRMNSYWKSYYWREDQQQYLKENLETLNTKTATKVKLAIEKGLPKTIEPYVSRYDKPLLIEEMPILVQLQYPDATDHGLEYVYGDYAMGKLEQFLEKYEEISHLDSTLEMTPKAIDIYFKPDTSKYRIKHICETTIAYMQQAMTPRFIKGETLIFNSARPYLQSYANQEVTIIEVLQENKNYDFADTGPVYIVKFNNGEQLEAYQEELTIKEE